MGRGQAWGSDLSWNSSSATPYPGALQASHFPSESQEPFDVQVMGSLLTVLRVPLAFVSSSLVLDLSSLSGQRVPRGAEPMDTPGSRAYNKSLGERNTRQEERNWMAE